MEAYRRIYIEGDAYYRKENCVTEVDKELLTEDELVQILLDQAVEEEIEISSRHITFALHRVTDREDRDLLETYIRYLERINQ